MSELNSMSLGDLTKIDPEQVIKMPAGVMVEIMAGCTQTFAEDCLDMAKENWTPGQYQQLKCLILAVLTGKAYPTKNRAEKNNSADGFMKELREYKKHIEGEFIPWNLIESTYKRLKEQDNG